MSALLVVKAARALCKLSAEACNVNEADLWKLEGDSFTGDAEIALEAAGVPELVDALESILSITREEHFIRGADSKLYEIQTYARLAVTMATGSAA